MKHRKNSVLSAIMGVAVGDAVGVPYEFSSRQDMQENPATDMTGYGTYNQPHGTWSDDSSLTFCLAESLVKGYNLEEISKKFIQWKDEAYWTARNEVFDIGITTSKSILRLKRLINENKIEELNHQKGKGGSDENGNGSLMRIIPLLFYIKGKSIHEQFEIIWEVSALTHRHIRAAMSCLIYLKIGEYILNGMDKKGAYHQSRKDIGNFWDDIKFPMDERKHFNKLIQNDITKTSEDELLSGGYVIEVLESSIWFFLKKGNYRDAIIGIINLGHDTDTSAAITGGLAGLYYGVYGIPSYWVNTIARKKNIIQLCESLEQKFNS